MKRAHILIALLLLAGFSSFKPSSQEVNWMDWNDGYAQASKDGKLLLVDVYTNWCGWCKKMDRDTYTDKDVRGAINKNFVAVKLNPERTDITYKIDTLTLNGYQLLNVLTQGERSGYPTTIIMNPRLNQVLLKEAGYQTTSEMKELLDKVLADNSRKKK